MLSFSVDLFSEGTCLQEIKQEITELSPLLNMAENPPRHRPLKFDSAQLMHSFISFFH